MLRVHDFSDLIETGRQNVLSVSLDVDPRKPEHQGARPAYRIWLRNALREIRDGLTEEATQEAEETAQRIQAYIEANRFRGRGLVLFAAPDLWREYILPFPVPNRARYGRPDLAPLLWALDEYNPYAILVVDRERARILTAYLGRTSVVEEETLELDTSDWRFKTGRQPTYTKRAGTGASRGTQLDTFTSRVEDHVRRFWQGAAEATAQWLRDLQIERLIIGGSEDAANTLRELLPEHTRTKIISLVALPANADLREIQERTLPLALAEKHYREAALVASVLDRAAAGTGGVVGKSATLDALIQGQVLTVAVDRDLKANLWRCTRCGHLSGKENESCPICGGPVERILLPQVLPLLARRSGARTVQVGEAAATRLQPHEGIGALLRYVSG
jgi:peptide subunit release factor 1 (eRF1)